MRIAVLTETDQIGDARRRDARDRQETNGARRRRGRPGRRRAKAGVPDADYEAAGATIARSARPKPWPDADIVLKVRRPSAAELGGLKRGAIVVAIMDPYGNEAALAGAGRGRALRPSPWS